MAKIAYDDLPDWAKEAIRDAGSTSMTQMLIGNDSLSVRSGKAIFNGKTVAAPGEAIDPNEPEETIEMNDLPRWARAQIRGTSRGSVTMMNGLQITADSSATYQGKRVVKGGKSGRSRWWWLRYLRYVSPF